MASHDPTDMGGVQETFLTTHWSMVGEIQERQDKDQALIGLLLQRYWKPVYCCLRRKGYGNEQAKDLTQGFFHEVVLNRKLVERADPSKGRFRAFLLHALNQYLIDEQRREAAQKRLPPTELVIRRHRTTGGHTYTFHIPLFRSELPAAWDHFGDVTEMILAALATIRTRSGRLLNHLPEIHNGLLFRLPL